MKIKRTISLLPLLLMSTVGDGSQAILGNSLLSESFESSIEKVDALIDSGNDLQACKAIGKATDRFANRAAALSGAQNDVINVLYSKYESASCDSVVSSALLSPNSGVVFPSGTSARSTENIAWWEGLSSEEKTQLKGSHPGGVDTEDVAKAVAEIIVATLQMGDREGEGRRAERMQQLHERQEANHEVEREARERDHQAIASPVISSNISDKSLDF